MANEGLRFKVGLFLITGFLLLAGGLLWIGASRVWKEYRSYVTYFSDSVQGLDVGSPVKFRGVPLGRVSAIRVAPDGNHVEVWLDLDPSFEVRPGLRARLGSVGITGAAFVELEYVGPEAAPPPRLGFPTPPDTIPSAPSFLTHLGADVAGLVADLRAADLAGLAADLRRLVRGSGIPEAAAGIERAAQALTRAASSLEALLGDPHLASAVEGIDRAAGSFASAADRADRLLADPAVTGIVEDLSAAAAEVRAAARELRQEVSGLGLDRRLDRIEGSLAQASRSLSEASRKAGEAAEAAKEATDRTGRSALRTLQRVEAAAARLETLARDLDETPSRALWETPSEENLP